MSERTSEPEGLEQALRTALDYWSVGVLILNSQAKVLIMNQMARKILDKSDGLFLDGGELQALSPAESANVRSLVQRGCSGFLTQHGEVTTIQRRQSNSPILVVVTPTSLPGTRTEPRDIALLFVLDPETNLRPDVRFLRKVFLLTEVESKIAALLAEGHTVSTICQRLNITANTARTHLRNIFHKTHTKRQAEFVARTATLTSTWKKFGDSLI